jgi:hypothetical protein
VNSDSGFGKGLLPYCKFDCDNGIYTTATELLYRTDDKVAYACDSGSGIINQVDLQVLRILDSQLRIGDSHSRLHCFALLGSGIDCLVSLRVVPTGLGKYSSDVCTYESPNDHHCG